MAITWMHERLLPHWFLQSDLDRLVASGTQDGDRRPNVGHEHGEMVDALASSFQEAREEALGAGRLEQFQLPVPGQPERQESKAELLVDHRSAGHSAEHVSVETQRRVDTPNGYPDVVETSVGDGLDQRPPVGDGGKLPYQTLPSLRSGGSSMEKQPSGPPQAPGGAERGTLSFDEFSRVDLRVALVKSAARVPSTDRLLELAIDLGDETRTIVAGIAHFYEPEALVGRRIVVVANLQPARIRGIESRGMLLAAGGRAQGEELGLVTLDKEIPPGTRVS